jgi:site-specific DNA recombinase
MRSVESKYLLTGLLACGLCGGSMVVMNRPVGGRDRYTYVCSNNRFRGAAVCKNNLWAPLEAADRAVLDAIATELLREEIVRAALDQALEIMRPSSEAGQRRRTDLQAELTKLSAEIARLTEAIAAGGDMTPLITAMKARDRRRAAVEAELGALEHAASLSE